VFGLFFLTVTASADFRSDCLPVLTSLGRRFIWRFLASNLYTIWRDSGEFFGMYDCGSVQAMLLYICISELTLSDRRAFYCQISNDVTHPKQSERPSMLFRGLLW